ncbi:uracil phosphoribosyltransferase-domain-containing protein [Apiospora saccharicola]|uniref:Uracil phosphoribosyltransferase-domain-containing protein n=1 Tax=Apiospora saccharicola TaxID=335842 RepID=A0ABR1WJH1_9PEZI
MSSNQRKEAPILTLIERKVSSLIEDFCAPSSSHHLMQCTIHALTRKIIFHAQGQGPWGLAKAATLIPVLRGGLPMYGSRDVDVEWLIRKPLPRLEDIKDSGPLILLDTVIATGDTLNKLCDQLLDMPGCTPRSVIIMTCYASPVALKRLAAHPVVKYLVVAKAAEQCDDNDHLVPSTNGDIGDKIYGAKCEKK